MIIHSAPWVDEPYRRAYSPGERSLKKDLATGRCSRVDDAKVVADDEIGGAGALLQLAGKLRTALRIAVLYRGKIVEIGAAHQHRALREVTTA